MNRRLDNCLLLAMMVFMLSLLPEIGFALGFGQIKLYSYLNEPLDAEIELQGADDIDTSHLMVSLASVEDFQRIELARPYLLSKLQFEVVQKNKKAFLKVTTEEPIKQTYLEFLVLMTWPEGRVVRDYTLLLDPAPFGGVSKRVANEQALDMLNKSNLDLPVPHVPFEDPKAVHALQEKLTKPENTIPATQVAEAKSDVSSISDTPTAIIADKRKPKVILGDSAISVSKKPISEILRNKFFLGSSLALLFILALTAWFLKRARSSVRLAPVHGVNIVEDIVIFDEEIRVKLELAEQYVALQEFDNAEAILAEIISRGNREEIKNAKAILKKIK